MAMQMNQLPTLLLYIILLLIDKSNDNALVIIFSLAHKRVGIKTLQPVNHHSLLIEALETSLYLMKHVTNIFSLYSKTKDH